MSKYCREDLYDGIRYFLYDNCFEDCFDSLVEEVRIVYDSIKQRRTLECESNDYFIGKSFKIDSYSWQIAESGANGEYTVLTFDKDADCFKCQHTVTNKIYLIDKHTIAYLMSADNQNTKFLYVGTKMGKTWHTVIHVE